MRNDLIHSMKRGLCPNPGWFGEFWAQTKGPTWILVIRQRNFSPKQWHLGKQNRPLRELSPVHLLPTLLDISWRLLFVFSPGDHAGINCQACLTPPCHLIIACNTPECWQCWAIDSWHSLKLLIIFSHKPLSDLSTSLYCLWRDKKKHMKISGWWDYTVRTSSQSTFESMPACALTQTSKGYATQIQWLLIPICRRNE